ncbi:MAG: DHHA1 domain-containing protein [Candidatus Woesearchaeota archaeon]
MYFQPFLFETKSIVKSIKQKDNFLFIELEKTIFYPGGGGQPHDTGIIKNNNFEGNVIEVFKETNNKTNNQTNEDYDNANQEKIIHKIKPIKGFLNENDSVDLILNKDRRINLIKMHTGEHILFKSLEKTLGEIKLNKIDLDEHESSLFILYEKELGWDLLFKAEELANTIIKENREIIEKEYPKTDAIMMEKIRIKPERIKQDLVRVIEIKDFDYSACKGTHAFNTNYVDFIVITKFNKDKQGYEIRFTTGNNAKKLLFEMSKISRVSTFLLETDLINVPTHIKKIKQESEDYKEKFRQISFKALDNYKIEEINYQNKAIRFIYNITENIEKKQLIDKANEIKENNEAIICFINKTDKEKAEILLTASDNLNINVPELLKKTIEQYKGKGGGKGNMAMGSFDSKNSNNILRDIKSNFTG